MAVFDRALLIALLSKCPEPQSAEDLWEPSLGEDAPTEAQVGRDLDRLLAEGVLVRTVHATYCGHCGHEEGFEYLYAIDPAWKARADEGEG
jgi:hypothetical protein